MWFSISYVKYFSRFVLFWRFSSEFSKWWIVFVSWILSSYSDHVICFCILNFSLLPFQLFLWLYRRRNHVFLCFCNLIIYMSYSQLLRQVSSLLNIIWIVYFYSKATHFLSMTLIWFLSQFLTRLWLQKLLITLSVIFIALKFIFLIFCSVGSHFYFIGSSSIHFKLFLHV